MEEKGRILVLDDEERMATLLARSLQRSGYSAEPATDPAKALELLKAERFDVLVTDLRMPGLDGIEILSRAKRIDPDIDVILMTAYASVSTVREALKRGAVEYLEKPVSAENDLKPLLEKLLSGEEERPEKAAPARIPGAAPKAARHEFLCPSPQMQELYRKAHKVARSNASVLLRGESGTGKEVLADMIQRESPHAKGPYLKINCGALPDTLLESELFGHVRGSFTGATGDREGLFRAANKGTLLLDEIAEVSPALQVKLLRVLQQGEFQPVGESRTHRVDVRIIAATNRHLEDLVEKGEFRQDLYYRLNVVPLEVPPLRERPEDLEFLIQEFLQHFGKARPVHFGDQAMEALRSYHWPGNIRELENAVEHALVLGEGEELQLEDLPAAVQDFARGGAIAGASAASPAVGSASLEDIEKACLLQALEKTRGNRTRAARLLQITRRTLGYRLRKFGLEEEVQRRYGNVPDDKHTDTEHRPAT